MKKITFLSVLIMLALSLQFCRNKAGSSQQNATDLMSARTLGLAYLEEFKLEEAEKEFLKFIGLAPEDKFGYANLGLTYLRMGNYPEAEKQLKKAIGIDSTDADIRLILSTVYKMNDQPDMAISELKKALSFAPDHVKVLYEISELYSDHDDAGSMTERKDYLQRLIKNAPGNLVPQLNLTEILLEEGNSDAALEQLEIIKKEFPEFPRESVEYYDKTISALRKTSLKDAILNFTIFHNYLKVTPPYQAGMMDLKGPGGSLIGFPLITFDRQTSSTLQPNESILDVIKFTEVSVPAGLSNNAAAAQSDDFSLVTASDYDGDEDIDLYVSGRDPSTGAFTHKLFNNNSGLFTDVSAEAGLDHSGRESSAIFGDYDNDGFLDLYIIREDGDLLYKNDGKGKFVNVTATANVGSKTGGNMSLFVDADHDGDLDIFEARSNKLNLLFRNNSDGSFTEQAEKMNLAGKNLISSDAAFGDFDEDGDIDLIVTNENQSNLIYANQRQGIFEDVTSGSGLESKGGTTTVAAGDYNNDGFLDVFTGSVSGTKNILYRNLGNGKFTEDKGSAEISRLLGKVNVYDAVFLDFDNDGFADLFIAGENREKNGKGLFLLHNDGKGNFSDVSHLLPEKVNSGTSIAVFDYNDDGDNDIAVARPGGGVALLRNDGGNNNHYMKIKLVGLRAGSAKNNHFGIGAKIEIRAGDLYQTMVVTNPAVMIGLGNRSAADVVRITWTNGVPQNLFMPAADQALIEAQTLKGSCPFLYAWNGNKYEFVKDIMWRSGLGMPLGIMGGNTAYAFADASDDYLRIPGEALKSDDGKFKLQVTSELWETIYTDELKLVAVDHPDSTDIFVEEQFSPPPFPGMKIYHIGKKYLPVSAVDSHGNNVLTYINAKDDKYQSDFQAGKYQGITEMKHLIVDPGKAGAKGKLLLFMNGWIFPTDASINVAISQTDAFKVIPPELQVLNSKGEWITVDNPGFPMGKDKTVIADLSGKFLSQDHRIRIRTNMEIYWDYIFFAEDVTAEPVITSEIEPTSADLHYRGFSASYRKGGRYGPHWFDYSSVSKESKWRDLKGNYTKYGDVLPLLKAPDNKYIISNAGDEISVSFSRSALPALKKGWKRDFLIHSVGWVKDGDINTAYGNTVTPLPFHGMKSYPPSPEDIYPGTPELQKYNQEYNTRVITADGYLNALKIK